MFSFTKSTLKLKYLSLKLTNNAKEEKYIPILSIKRINILAIKMIFFIRKHSIVFYDFFFQLNKKYFYLKSASRLLTGRIFFVDGKLHLTM